MTKKPRGAPRGNRNALKHGFYSSVFKANERRVLNHIPFTDLSGEIELIRVANFRFLQALNLSQQPLDVETQLAAIRAVNLSAQSITSLIRAQALAALTAGDDKLEDFLERLQSGGLSITLLHPDCRIAPMKGPNEPTIWFLSSFLPFSV